MPPTNAGHRSTASRPVVPVIPLPFVRQQRQAAAAATAAPKTANTTPFVGSSQPGTSGSIPDAASSSSVADTPPTSVSPTTASETHHVPISGTGTNDWPQTNGRHNADELEVVGSHVVHAPEQSATTAITSTGRPAVIADPEISISTPEAVTQNMNRKANNGMAPLAPISSFSPAQTVVPPTTSPSHFANVPQTITLPSFGPPMNYEYARSVGHRPQPSNGSLVFGGLHDSNTSSPAPLSGGHFHPPREPLPFNPEAMHYNRHSALSPTADGYPPVPRFPDAGTPLSAPGSQSSIHGEDAAPAHIPHANGHNGFTPHHLPHPSFSGPDMRAGPLDPGMRMMGDLDEVDLKLNAEVMDNMRASFNDPEFADCQLEILLPPDKTIKDYRDSAALPGIKIFGHRHILAKSPLLRERMRTHGTTPDNTLRLHSHGKFLRSESLYHTVRSLYGYHIGNFLPAVPPPASDVMDLFKLSMSYAEAGRFLQLNPVIVKGIQGGIRTITWETIETVFEMTLPHFIVPLVTTRADVTRESTAIAWSRGMEELLRAAVHFVVHHFPSNFVLNTTSGTPSFLRLPNIEKAQGEVTAPISTPPVHITAAPIVHGTSRHHRQSSKAAASQLPGAAQGVRNPQLRNIKFGDLSLEGANGNAEAPPVANGQANRRSVHQARIDATASRLLLHLPFPLVKDILESPRLAGLSGGLPQEALGQLLSDVVQARESSRMELGRHLRDNPIQGHHSWPSRLESRQPQPVTSESDYLANNLGFQEGLVDGANGPTLAQHWAPASIGFGQ